VYTPTILFKLMTNSLQLLITALELIFGTFQYRIKYFYRRCPSL
jgi:hypothetical protein